MISLPQLSPKPVVKGNKATKNIQPSEGFSCPNQRIIMEDNVDNLINQLQAPYCLSCQIRKADQVCISKACGPQKYLNIICGKCHSDVHAESTNKPQMSIEEYFRSLLDFIREQKDIRDNNTNSQTIDIKDLQLAIGKLNDLRRKLNEVKQKVKDQIAGNKSPKQMQERLQKCFIKLLSKGTYQNVQEKLKEMKQEIIFENNKFVWKGADYEFCQYQKDSRELYDSIQKVNNQICLSFQGGNKINLTAHKFLPSQELLKSFSLYETTPIECIDGQFSISGSGTNTHQYYLDHILDWNKKYRMRIKFSKKPQMFVSIGIIPISKVSNSWVYHEEHGFFKCFFLNGDANPQYSRILQGRNLSFFPIEGTQIEMRIDFQNRYMDSADYPEYQNRNANFITRFPKIDQQYVIAIAIYQDQTVVFESLEEIAYIDSVE